MTKMPVVIKNGGKRLSRSEIVARLQEFAVRWRGILDNPGVEQANIEQRHAQTYWAELYGCFGLDAASVAIYEMYAERAGSVGLGRVDLFQPSVVIGEAKSPGVNLDVAVRQATEYLVGGSIKPHEVPRYILCHNFEYLRNE
ncbi:hypothetical protein HMPREF3145_09845 [Corynebacterium sp. HMSC05C01]|uniref:type IIL restriction-modification enzyme MmeI n=1 Tax=Corynebacterium sp. HMSC05C01 TaxID=1581113 RepID=UPI0008D20ED1|nr:type IIL restriction-modification enzyme MmeI [Corynebacterium sp. HMSC05C01]OFT68082.1 hypothetical protein HMPREF3145_09845 [Corynebacterium sp. HMSC05C01]